MTTSLSNIAAELAAIGDSVNAGVAEFVELVDEALAVNADDDVAVQKVQDNRQKIADKLIGIAAELGAVISVEPEKKVAAKTAAPKDK